MGRLNGVGDGEPGMTVRMNELFETGTSLQSIATGFVFTEGPVWRADAECLLFSDLRASKRYSWNAESGVTEICAETYKGNGMALDGAGRLLVCEHVTSTVVAMSPDGSGADRKVLASHYRGAELNNPNDVVVGPDGGIWFTDPPAGRRNDVSGKLREPELDFQAVFRLGMDGVLEPMATGFELCNGLAFSPNGSLLYVTDTYAGKIYVMPVAADGSLGERQVFCDVGPLDVQCGWVDGLRCDELGNVWSTGPFGVWVLSPTGELIGRLGTPEIASNLTWGGSDGFTLFITATTSVYAIRTSVTVGRRYGPS